MRVGIGAALFSVSVGSLSVLSVKSTVMFCLGGSVLSLILALLNAAIAVWLLVVFVVRLVEK